MLKRIIKLNGSVEDFIPEKLNKWSRWASEDIRDRVDWSGVVFEAVRNSPEEMSSQDLQMRLINSCLEHESWPYYLMAGRLYAAYVRKKMYGGLHMPAVKKMHKKLIHLGLMRHLNYTEEEYEAVEELIDHKRDFNLAHFQIDYILHKYSLQDKVNDIQYETPQYVYMRMAMALAEDEPKDKRLEHIKNWYDHLSLNRINAPTPNYNNLGTKHYGLASCCLYAVGDDVRSLAIGDHIAYTQTYMSAGIGSNIMTRSLGNPIRNGAISHQGKLPYYKALAGATKANVQGGRGGACTTYFSCYDPEVMTIIMLQNPRSTEDKKNRDLHYAFMTNRLFAKKVAKNEDIFVFNAYTAPELQERFYSSDQDGFEELYNKYESDPSFKKTYISARKILIAAGEQSYDVSTLYYAIIDEMNRHTPFKDTIYSSNLCLEVTNPTKPYYNMKDLYSTDHHNGEIGLCNLAGIVEYNIKSEEEYASACYYALKMIDKCIDIADYELPHLGYTAKMRRNASVGLIGLATTMARANVKYGTTEGRNKLHEVAERHAYHVTSQSLRLGQEVGNAPWMDKTKWPDGWLFIDTYKKNVDELVTVNYKYDWEALRKAIIANGGIRHSSLIAHMPSESSSKASGAPNSVYPIRYLAMNKTDASSLIKWCAVDSDLLADKYQIAFTVPEVDMIKDYSVIQKFTDQAISADLYRDRTQVIDITTNEIIEIYLAMVKYGLKTRYYINTLTSKAYNPKEHISNELINIAEESNEEHGCAGGFCTL